MKINIIYDASVDSAPAGYKQAVETAAAFYEKAYTDPITVNITFGYGKAGSETLTSNEIGLSYADHGYGLTYTEMRSALGADVRSADDLAAVLALPNYDLTGGGLFYVPSAQAKALGVVSPQGAAVDGYVGINSSLPFFYDAGSSTSNAYDAVATLEHEIGHVLGRIAIRGEPLPDGSRLFSELDLLRYASVGVRSLTGNGSFSVDGQYLPIAFNDPANGGSDADWASANPFEAYNAFGSLGRKQTVGEQDQVLNDALGYDRIPSLSLPFNVSGLTGSTSKLDMTMSFYVTLGTPLTIKNPAQSSAAYVHITNTPGVFSTVYLSDVFFAVSDQAGPVTALSVTGDSTNPLQVLLDGPPSIFTAKRGSIQAISIHDSAWAIKADSLISVENFNYILARSDAADATGVEINNFASKVINHGAITASGYNTAIGVVGADLDNSGMIEVESKTTTAAQASAIGVLDPVGFRNSGSIVAASQASGGLTVGVEITHAQGITYFNSGTISAGFSFWEKFSAPSPTDTVNIQNSGKLIGSMVLEDAPTSVRNSGVIAGDIFLSDYTNVFNGAGGRFIGDLYLGAGVNTVTLGDDGESVIDGGGSGSITGGAGVDTVSYQLSQIGVTVDLNLAGSQSIGGGQFEALAGIENLTGGRGADRLTGNAGANFLYDRAGGDDILSGGGGADILTVSRSASAAASTVVLDGGAGGDRLSFDGGQRFSDQVTLQGGAGDDLIYAGGAQVGTIDAGAGADTVILDLLGGDSPSNIGDHYTVTLGQGADVLRLEASDAAARKGGPVLVTDFQAGPGSDQLDLTDYLHSGAVKAYTAGDDPFASGALQLVQQGADTLVQTHNPGAGAGYTTLLILKSVDAASLFPSNLGGLLSNLASARAMNGGAGADSLVGGAGTDLLFGLDGDDKLTGGAGSDYLDGGAGIDTAIYAGLSRAYTITLAAQAATVAGGPEGGADALTGIERLQFVDGYLSIGTADAAARVYRIYQAALGREPDPVGLANWTNALDNGASLQSIGDGFLNSPEFVARFGAGSNSQFVTLLYKNVLGRDPDAQGLNNWVNSIASGHSRSEVLTGFSESAEFINSTAPTVQQGLWIGDANAAKVARLYDTVFGRLPDASGEAAWTGALQHGASLQTVADGFVNADEFKAVYGALDDGHFVDLLYHNVLGRAGDDAGMAGWIKSLATGHSRAEVVIGFSESSEHIANLAPHIDDGVWFG